MALVSGGTDSSTLLYMCMGGGFDVYPLFVNYGQLSCAQELKSAKIVCDQLDARAPMVLEVKMIGRLSRNQLTAADSSDPFFPHRNLMLLTLAAVYAQTLNCSAIAFGAVSGSNVPFPDCSPIFIHSATRALTESFGQPVKVYAPYASIDKAEVIRYGASKGVPYELTYSCYLGLPEHCGKCLACQNRKNAFKLAGISDPTRYAQSC
ncbi:MAG: 7-cyano-7-deazaguanine synthase [archaeon]|nr:7-cyano-7-deazaguanine synthase [archaeon]